MKIKEDLMSDLLEQIRQLQRLQAAINPTKIQEEIDKLQLIREKHEHQISLIKQQQASLKTALTSLVTNKKTGHDKTQKEESSNSFLDGLQAVANRGL